MHLPNMSLYMTACIKMELFFDLFLQMIMEWGKFYSSTYCNIKIIEVLMFNVYIVMQWLILKTLAAYVET